MLEKFDVAIINSLQGGFPLLERPYEAVAETLGVEEQNLIDRIEQLLVTGHLSRFGPMFNADRMGGAFCLCAVAVPEGAVDEIAALINEHPEVAHNYERDHQLNIWFVLATEEPDRIESVAQEIERQIGHQVYRFPKLQEFFIGLKVEAPS